MHEIGEVWVSVLLDGSFELLGGDLAGCVGVDYLEGGGNLGFPSCVKSGAGFVGNGSDGILDFLEIPFSIIVLVNGVEDCGLDFIN